MVLRFLVKNEECVVKLGDIRALVLWVARAMVHFSFPWDRLGFVLLFGDGIWDEGVFYTVRNEMSFSFFTVRSLQFLTSPSVLLAFFKILRRVDYNPVWF